jgi:hypothetical protein
MNYHESEGPSLRATREKERPAHHIRVYPTDHGFRVEHHTSSRDSAPKTYTYSTGQEVADHIHSVASIPGREVKPKPEDVKTEYGRAPEGEE